MVFVCILLGFGVLLVVPGIQASKRASNERRATSSLKDYSNAQEDFRSNDRDGNGVNDYWTADVAGLYHVRGVKLIDPAVADADSHPLRGEYPVAGTPDQGYRFRALNRDLQDGVAYADDTDGSGRCLHHLSKFGAAAIPESNNSDVYIINEGHSLFKREFPSTALFEPDWPLDLQQEWAHGG